MNLRILRSFLVLIKNTPFHPQWIALREDKRTLLDVNNYAEGRVVDIGCGQKLAKRVLSDGCEYIGLDYLQTAGEWYGTYPDVYGDAQQLPFLRASTNTVLLLDVLEHLPSPKSCITEILRILKPKGKLIIQVPFMYPLHDAPLDFHRWTEFGLERLFKEHDLEQLEKKPMGAPIESAALLSCIALSKHVINWYEQKNPLCLLAFLLPLAVLAINCSSWLIARLSRDDGLMPVGYRYVLRKA